MEQEIEKKAAKSKIPTLLIGLLVIGVVGLALYFLVFAPKTEPSEPDVETTKVATTSTTTNPPATKVDFGTPKKSPHFVDSTPLHSEVYASQPINITINFNFDIDPSSTISVTKDGQEWTQGSIKVENNKLSLKKDLKQGMTDGVYVVSYLACWPDKSCHDGTFSFQIDSSKKSEYKDMTGKKEVTIDLKNIAFQDTKVLISSGTKVTWVNMDTELHYINSDTHPNHSYFPEQNSKALSQGQSFVTTFLLAGQYNYHCSAHASSMIGSILVTK